MNEAGKIFPKMRAQAEIFKKRTVRGARELVRDERGNLAGVGDGWIGGGETSPNWEKSGNGWPRVRLVA
jgi:hypothetical protein